MRPAISSTDTLIPIAGEAYELVNTSEPILDRRGRLLMSACYHDSHRILISSRIPLAQRDRVIACAVSAACAHVYRRRSHPRSAAAS